MSRSLAINERWFLVLDEWQRVVRKHVEDREAKATMMSRFHNASNVAALAGSAIGCVASLVALMNSGIATVISIVACGAATIAISTQLTFVSTSRVRDASLLASRYRDLSRRIDIERLRQPTSSADAQERLSAISGEYTKLDEKATIVLGIQIPVPLGFNLESGVREIASAPSNTAMAGLGLGLWSYASAMSDADEQQSTSSDR